MNRELASNREPSAGVESWTVCWHRIVNRVLASNREPWAGIESWTVSWHRIVNHVLASNREPWAGIRFARIIRYIVNREPCARITRVTVTCLPSHVIGSSRVSQRNETWNPTSCLICQYLCIIMIISKQRQELMGPCIRRITYHDRAGQVEVFVSSNRKYIVSRYEDYTLWSINQEKNERHDLQLSVNTLGLTHSFGILLI